MSAVIGTAGWSIGKGAAGSFSDKGTALERYSRVFDGTEVNSTFYRPHRSSTWAKWATTVPDHFRFSVKIPKAITHQANLVDVDTLTTQFARSLDPLGAKLAVLLVQLPPKLGFARSTAEHFFTHLRRSTHAAIVCEPRNATWFDPEVDAILAQLRVARVAADPALGPAAAVPGGWPGLTYWRLHGSPSTYRSSYTDRAIDSYGRELQTAIDRGLRPWCVFDNTAASAATGNALSMIARLNSSRADPSCSR